MSFGDLRGILQYVPQFRGRLFVVSLDGAVIASPGFSNTLLDIAVLHSLNVKMIVTCGASHQIRTLGERRGITPSSTDGLGRTDDATLELAIDAISRLSSRLMQDFTAVKLRAACPNSLIARPAGIIGGQDFENTGTIESVDSRGLLALVDEGMIPIVPPLGYGSKVDTLRVNSDAAACEIAAATKAFKLIYVSSEAPEFPGDKQVPRLSVQEAKRIAADLATSKPGLSSKLRFGARACEKGVNRSHIIDGTSEEVLLAELFSNEGVGTMIHEDVYVEVRSATDADVPEMISMMNHSVEDSALISRNRDEIVANLADYFVLSVDDHVVGCVAVHQLEEALSELACLYVKKDHSGMGYGTQLVNFATQEARRRGSSQLIALSTQAAGFFEAAGFVATGREALPADRLQRYLNTGRNARIMVKSGL